ncbi:MAG: hypothetical protein ABIZ91_09730 [Gemmatimonadaceae bacterium]
MGSRKASAARERRAPMGESAHDVGRAARGRTSSSKTPVHIRDTRAPDSGEAIDRDWLRQRLGFKLGKFATAIDRVDVMIRDESGPTGKPTVSVTIQLRVSRGESIAATARGTSARLAASAAIRSCERAVRRQLERSQLKRKSAPVRVRGPVED